MNRIALLASFTFVVLTASPMAAHAWFDNHQPSTGTTTPTTGSQQVPELDPGAAAGALALLAGGALLIRDRSRRTAH